MSTPKDHLDIVFECARAIELRNPMPICDERGWYMIELSGWTGAITRRNQGVLNLGSLGCIRLSGRPVMKCEKCGTSNSDVLHVRQKLNGLMGETTEKMLCEACYDEWCNIPVVQSAKMPPGTVC